MSCGLGGLSLSEGQGQKGASAVVGAPGGRDEFMEKQLQILCVVIIIVYIVYYVTQGTINSLIIQRH